MHGRSPTAPSRVALAELAELMLPEPAGIRLTDERKHDSAPAIAGASNQISTAVAP